MHEKKKYLHFKGIRPPNIKIYQHKGPHFIEFYQKRALRTNIYVRIISVLLLVTQETELCL